MRRALVASLVLGAVAPSAADPASTTYDLTFVAESAYDGQPLCTTAVKLPDRAKLHVTLPARSSSIIANGVPFRSNRSSTKTATKIGAYAAPSETRPYEMFLLLDTRGEATLHILTTEDNAPCAVCWSYAVAP